MSERIFPFGWSNPTRLALVIFFSNLYLYIPVSTLYLQSKELSYTQINSLWAVIVAIMGLVIGRIGDVSLTAAFLFMGTVVTVGALLFWAE